MRYSSLDEWMGAEDVTGLKLCTEVEDFCLMAKLVEERSVSAEAAA